MDTLGKLQTLKKLQSLPSYCPVRFLCFSSALQPRLCKMHANHEPIVSCTINVRGTVQNQSHFELYYNGSQLVQRSEACAQLRHKTPRTYLEDIDIFEKHYSYLSKKIISTISAALYFLLYNSIF